MSQQQNQNENENLPSVQQSGADVKPFSIRNISQNWPFEEKHLQLCLKNGLKEKDLFPPLEASKASHDGPLKGCSKIHSPNDDNNKEADSCNAEVPQDIVVDECNNKVINHHSSHEEGNHSNQSNCCNYSGGLSPPEDACPLSSSTNVHKNSPPLPLSSKAVKYARKRRKGKCREQTLLSENISKAEAVDEDSCRKSRSEDRVM
ncbi:unnamed protein product [Sphenostylis stenocarpa]|nr:unnamed protein product [Sphenostylis stenocarpa]